MVTRIIALISIVLTSLVLTGCGGTLVIGGKPTYATNKVDLGGTEASSSTTGPGYKSQTYQSTSRLGYNLGSGKDRIFCYYDQGNAVSTYKNSQGKTVYQQNSSRRDCRPDPEQEPVVKSAAAPTPTPKDATCGDFRSGDSAGRLVRDCYTRSEPAAGRLSCITGWEEVWVNGVLAVTGIDTATPNCSPKAAPAPTAAPAAAQQPRPSFGRK